MSLQTTINSGSASLDNVTCRFCRRQFSKYTCPTCNVPYCSLTCFRSQAHSQCSETFYKKEIEAEIQSEPSKTPLERLKMMELLKKFEEEHGKDNLDILEREDADEDEDDGTDLAQRFQGIDLDSSSPSDLWSKLTPEEQAQFIKALEDPSSELAQQLLASEEMENERREPWWESSLVEGSDSDVERPSRQRYGERPQAIRIPTSMVKPLPRGSPLLYNMCTLCIAYSYTTRHLASSPLSSLPPTGDDVQEGRQLIAKLVPFLTDRKATTIHTSLSSLITDIWARFDPGEMTSELFSLLLRDMSQLIQPLAVTTVLPQSKNPTEIDPSSHPHVNLILVFSDLTALFEASKKGQVAHNHVALKLLFYAAQALSIPSPIFRALAHEAREQTVAYQNASKTSAEAGLVPERKQARKTGPIIEEI